jgi:hypothetical protein
MNEEKIIEAFHLTWNNFPETVRLIRRDRTIIAINKAGVNSGIQIGSKCSATLPSERHKGCLANKALETGKYTYDKVGFENDSLLRFWIPVNDTDEYFIHFLLGINIKLVGEFL